MVVIKPTDKVIISITLPDGETDKGMKAYIYNSSGVNVTPNEFIPVVHVANGLYANVGGADIFLPEGTYFVQLITYNNTNYDTLDEDYGTAGETYMVVADSAYLSQELNGINDTLKMLKSADIELEMEDISEEIQVDLEDSEEITVEVEPLTT